MAYGTPLFSTVAAAALLPKQKTTKSTASASSLDTAAMLGSFLSLVWGTETNSILQLARASATAISSRRTIPSIKKAHLLL